MTRNIGTSSRLAIMCGFAVGHILRPLERREVASEEVCPRALVYLFTSFFGLRPVALDFRLVFADEALSSIPVHYVHYVHSGEFPVAFPFWKALPKNG